MCYKEFLSLLYSIVLLLSVLYYVTRGIFKVCDAHTINYLRQFKEEIKIQRGDEHGDEKYEFRIGVEIVRIQTRSPRKKNFKEPDPDSKIGRVSAPELTNEKIVSESNMKTSQRPSILFSQYLLIHFLLNFWSIEVKKNDKCRLHMNFWFRVFLCCET